MHGNEFMCLDGVKGQRNIKATSTRPTCCY